MQARDYARRTPDEHVGYVECLQMIRQDQKSGEGIDFTGWQEAERLSGIREESFTLLLDMYRNFCGTKQEKVFRTMKSCGLSVGARRKEAKNFDREAQKYINGEQSGTEASKNCGLNYTTFQYRVQTLLKEKFNAEEDETYRYIQEVCNMWKRHELNKTQASEKLGIKIPTFNRLLKAQGIERDSEPAGFADVYALWLKKKITKEEAARRCGIGRTYFDQLVRMREQKATEISHTEQSV